MPLYIDAFPSCDWIKQGESDVDTDGQPIVPVIHQHGPTAKQRKYSEDEPRDERGRWTTDGGGGAEEATSASLPNDPAARGVALGVLMRNEVAAGHETQAIHDRVNDKKGVYTEERQRIHDQIVNDVLQRAIDRGVQADHQAYLLAGLPGAGKTSSLDMVVDPRPVVAISADDMKEELAARGLFEPPPGAHALEAAPLIHEESSDLARQLQGEALQRGLNVDFDITGWSRGQLTDRIDAARANGYSVTGVFVDVPVSTAIDRAESRYTQGLAQSPDTARFTPPENIRSQSDPTGTFNSANRAVFEEMKSRMDRFVIMDNSGRGPRVIDSSGDVPVRKR